MWSYGLDLRSIRLTIIKVVVSIGVAKGGPKGPWSPEF